jgi:hypothetical protein
MAKLMLLLHFRTTARATHRQFLSTMKMVKFMDVQLVSSIGWLRLQKAIKGWHKKQAFSRKL